MAWRDSRRNRGRLFLFISSVVLGIAALVSTLSFGYNLREDVDDQAKELVGADLVLRGRHGIRDSVQAMKAFAGARRSESKSMASMVFFPRTQSSRLVQLIGLSGDYPYYGTIETKPASAARNFRGKPEALVDQTLMLEFGVRVGDSIRVGTIDLVIAGPLLRCSRSEPGVVDGSGARLYSAPIYRLCRAGEKRQPDRVGDLLPVQTGDRYVQTHGHARA